MIDPIQFRPYDPSTDNRPIGTTDVTPGFDRNTQRIVKDMQNFNQQERRNDAIRVDNSKLYGQGLADLGKFSETLTNVMKTGAEAYIKSEEDAAAADALYGDIPISQNFEEEIQQVEVEGKLKMQFRKQKLMVFQLWLLKAIGLVLFGISMPKLKLTFK